MSTVERLPLDTGLFAVTKSERWVRGVIDGVALVDSREQTLVWVPGEAVPRYAFTRRDVRMDLLVPSRTPPSRQTFFTPNGASATWFDIVIGDRHLENAAWSWNDPDLSDLVSVSWSPRVLDHWLEENDIAVLHPRDPFKRVDALPSSRHVIVSFNGAILADSDDPVLLFETGLPARYYLPPVDVDFDLLASVDTSTICPYKGTADRNWAIAAAGDDRVLAWSYSSPRPAVTPIAGRVAFYNEFLDITVDGVELPRPDTEFSDR